LRCRLIGVVGKQFAQRFRTAAACRCEAAACLVSKHSACAYLDDGGCICASRLGGRCSAKSIPMCRSLLDDGASLCSNRLNCGAHDSSNACSDCDTGDKCRVLRTLRFVPRPRPERPHMCASCAARAHTPLAACTSRRRRCSRIHRRTFTNIHTECPACRCRTLCPTPTSTAHCRWW
jgi:hypothetical protein